MRTAVLLSGGVDSSVALHLVRRAGEACTAFYLKVWLEDELTHLGHCPWEEDLRFARAVCATEGVELEVLSLQRVYQERVVRAMVEELRSGRTPSPDLWCNQRIKFGAFVDVVSSEFERVVSGHYARLRHGPSGVRLLSAADPVKDQTYFLCLLSQAQLARCRFPLGSLCKTEVRRFATEAGLATAARPDSQGICFLGRVRFEDFVAAHLGERRGEIVELESQRVLGEHRGYWFYTIGQRRGLGLSGGPWYVVAKDVEANRVSVSRSPLRHRAGAEPVLQIPDPRWNLAPPIRRELRVKIRHGPRQVPARISGGGSGGISVRLAEPDPGIAPGQFAVFYDGDVCLGGGRIERVGWGAASEVGRISRG